ncbi:MAG: hypothetical protein R3C32_11150 [Chloroflexota bacterium]
MYEPVYNVADPATDLAVARGETWDALDGGSATWWNTRDMTGIEDHTYVTWQDILDNNPDAKVILGLGASVGSGIPAFDGSVDALVVGISGDDTTYDFEDTPQCATDCYVSPSGNDLNGGTSYADAKRTIQAAIDTVQAGGTVHVDDGTYAESPNIPKSLTLTSENGRDATTIQLQTGPTIATGSLTIAGDDVTVDDFRSSAETLPRRPSPPRTST